MAQYGLFKEHTRNAIVIVAAEMTVLHLHELQALFESTNVKTDFIMNCYIAETVPSDAYDTRLRDYMEKQELGSLISVKDDPSSFSLGPYVKISGDSRTFAVSIFHGL
jgi:hypothetical protein